MATDTADRQRHKLNNVQDVKPVGVAFFDLRHGQCKFPLGGVSAPVEFFCGKRAEAGKPYCGAHCRVAYVRATRPVSLKWNGKRPREVGPSAKIIDILSKSLEER